MCIEVIRKKVLNVQKSLLESDGKLYEERFVKQRRGFYGKFS